MSLLAICCHDTVENDRTNYTKETLRSLRETVNNKKHRIFIIDNGSCADTKAVLLGAKKAFNNITLITLSENIGTARGINFGIRSREPGEFVTKMDNDVVVHESGWLDKMEKVFAKRPEIGILGLRRNDVYGELIPDRGLLMNADIMGTCTMFNPALLDKIGLMFQISPKYGGDDVLMSVRSLAAGFKNAFLPSIKITHLDDGKNLYCEWKRREAGVYLHELSIVCDMIKKGDMPYYYDGE